MQRKDRLIHCLPPEDGIIATLLNSKVSLLIVKWLSKTKVNPNQVTVLAFWVGLIAALLFFTGRYLYVVIGAILLEISFTLDMADGELARLKNMPSRIGAWFDRVSDRFVEFTVIAGLTYGYYKQNSVVTIWILGLVTICSLFIRYYAGDILGPLPAPAISARRKQAENLSRLLKVKNLIKPGYLSFSRDVEMAIIFLGCIFNQTILLFWVIIILSNIHWIARAFVYWRSVE